ncbi:MAG: VanW family protein [Endomicrobium sp.]|jgi:vancomycin resistance protein VanW|nr:VanW family protein [Endomicrobium sp.]
MKKPIRRSSLRLFAGKTFFIYKRYFQWFFGQNNFAKSKTEKLANSVFSHKSVIMRKLKNVEMYLQENKRTNLRLASEKINNIVIKPGETFSFWKTVGKTTRSKGYLEGLALKNGALAKDTGGGLCQLANLLYWMTLHTPLQVTERWRHGYDVFPDSNRTLPFGSGATVSYNYIDLQICNPTTNQDFQICLWLDGEFLNGEIRSDKNTGFTYEIVEKNHTIESTFWGGHIRHNELYRNVYGGGKKFIREEFITENNAVMMYNPLLEGNKQ